MGANMAPKPFFKTFLKWVSITFAKPDAFCQKAQNSLSSWVFIFPERLRYEKCSKICGDFKNFIEKGRKSIFGRISAKFRPNFCRNFEKFKIQKLHKMNHKSSFHLYFWLFLIISIQKYPFRTVSGTLRYGKFYSHPFGTHFKTHPKKWCFNELKENNWTVIIAPCGKTFRLYHI